MSVSKSLYISPQKLPISRFHIVYLFFLAPFRLVSLGQRL